MNYLLSNKINLTNSLQMALKQDKEDNKNCLGMLDDLKSETKTKR